MIRMTMKRSRLISALLALLTILCGAALFAASSFQQIGIQETTAGKAGFITACCLLVSALGEDFIENAQLFSKEVENCAENIDALMDAVYDHPAFSPENLTALLRNS